MVIYRCDHCKKNVDHNYELVSILIDYDLGEVENQDLQLCGDCRLKLSRLINRFLLKFK